MEPCCIFFLEEKFWGNPECRYIIFIQEGGQMLINHNLSYHSEYGNTKEDKFKDWALSAFRDCGDKEKNNKIEKEQKTQQRQQWKPREKIPLKKAESNVLCAVNGSSKMRANITHQTQQCQSLGRFGPENWWGAMGIRRDWVLNAFSQTHVEIQSSF